MKMGIALPIPVAIFFEGKITYRVVPGHRNRQIETAVWNWAGFFTEGFKTCWQQFGQFLNDL